MILTIPILFATSLALATPSKCVVPRENDCSFYSDCIESVIPCGPDAYTLGYGMKYCQSFGLHVPEFSPKGQDWIYSVMTCLQVNLVPIANQSSVLDCDSLRTFAYATHPKCYTIQNHSICTLPPADVIKILGVIRNELADGETFKQMVAVATTCAFDIDAAIKKYLHWDDWPINQGNRLELVDN